MTTSEETAARAGRYVAQPTGYWAFMPAPLPPQPPVALTGELQGLLSLADFAAAAAKLPGVETFRDRG